MSKKEKRALIEAALKQAVSAWIDWQVVGKERPKFKKMAKALQQRLDT